MPQSEKEITRSIRGLLKRLRIFHYKAWQGMMSTPGVSDIIGCYEGRFFAIEVKTPTGKVTDVQKKFLQHVKEAGGIGIVARCVEDAVKGLGVQDQLLFL